eukprot:gene2046-biopygen1944
MEEVEAGVEADASTGGSGALGGTLGLWGGLWGSRGDSWGSRGDSGALGGTRGLWAEVALSAWGAASEDAGRAELLGKHSWDSDPCPKRLNIWDFGLVPVLCQMHGLQALNQLAKKLHSSIFELSKKQTPGAARHHGARGSSAKDSLNRMHQDRDTKGNGKGSRGKDAWPYQASTSSADAEGARSYPRAVGGKAGVKTAVCRSGQDPDEGLGAAGASAQALSWATRTLRPWSVPRGCFRAAVRVPGRGEAKLSTDRGLGESDFEISRERGFSWRRTPVPTNRPEGRAPHDWDPTDQPVLFLEEGKMLVDVGESGGNTAGWRAERGELTHVTRARALPYMEDFLVLCDSEAEDLHLHQDPPLFGTRAKLEEGDPALMRRMRRLRILLDLHTGLATRPGGDQVRRRPGPEATRPGGDQARRRPGPEATRPEGDHARRRPGPEASNPGGGQAWMRAGLCKKAQARRPGHRCHKYDTTSSVAYDSATTLTSGIKHTPVATMRPRATRMDFGIKHTPVATMKPRATRMDFGIKHTPVAIMRPRATRMDFGIKDTPVAIMEHTPVATMGPRATRMDFPPRMLKDAGRK